MVAGLVAVCGMWGVFWGAWSGLVPSVQERVGASPASLGLVLVSIPIGAIPAMVLTGRLARGREGGALAAAMAAFGAGIAMLAAATSPVELGLALLVVGMTSGAVDVCLNLAIARTGWRSGSACSVPAC